MADPMSSFPTASDAAAMTDAEIARRLQLEINASARARKAPSATYDPAPLHNFGDQERKARSLATRKKNAIEARNEARKKLRAEKAKKRAAAAKRAARKDKAISPSVVRAAAPTKNQRAKEHGVASSPPKKLPTPPTPPFFTHVRDPMATHSSLIHADAMVPVMKDERVKDEDEDEDEDEDDEDDGDDAETATTRTPATPAQSRPKTGWQPGDSGRASKSKSKSNPKPKKNKKKNAKLNPAEEAAAADAEARLPRCDLAPPDGYRHGRLVWARIADAKREDGGVWWPGRVWKLSNCARAKELWARRGASAVAPRALVRCFGDGSFVWSAAEDLKRYVGEDAAEREATIGTLLAAAAPSKGHRKKKGEKGVRIYLSVARKALQEVAEAELEAFEPPWSDSDDGDGEPGNVDAPVGNGGRSGFEIYRPPALEVDVVNEESAKDGLTPDWIVDAACRVFCLNVPTVDEPIIRGLLDPCTNNKRRPNIPAEKTFDKKQDGLKQENEWKGYHVVLNPSYESQVQWRFINRAINEVEWGFCPGILLVCRNSTDTSYFQRLHPFPRIFLRRDAIRFKDYDNTPIGFGIAVFCMVAPTVTKSEKLETYRRFYDEFSHAGELNVPFDRTFLEHPAFEDLTDRLHEDAAKKYRDSWVACDVCDRWRELPYGQSLIDAQAKDKWSCAEVYASGCDAPLTNREFKAFSVARKGQAVALKADKHGTDILPGAGEARRIGERAHDERAHEEGDEEEEEEEEEEDAVLALPCPPGSEDDDGGARRDGGDCGDDDAMDQWLDEVKLRGGRKRYGFAEAPIPWKKHRPGGDASSAVVKKALRRARERRAKDAASGGVAGATPELLMHPEWMGKQSALSEAGSLSEFEKSRLERIRVNHDMLRKLIYTKEDVADAALTKAAEASAAEAAARRVFRVAEDKNKRALHDAETATARSRKANAAAAVAAAEAAAADTASAATAAELQAAAEVVIRLSAKAAEADAACTAAEAAAAEERGEEKEEDGA